MFLQETTLAPYSSHLRSSIGWYTAEGKAYPGPWKGPSNCFMRSNARTAADFRRERCFRFLGIRFRSLARAWSRCALIDHLENIGQTWSQSIVYTNQHL